MVRKYIFKRCVFPSHDSFRGGWGGVVLANPEFQKFENPQSAEFFLGEWK